MTREQTAAELLIAFGANFTTSRPGPLRAAPLVRRCFTCDRALRDDEGDPCDRCNDADYYRAQEKDDR